MRKLKIVLEVLKQWMIAFVPQELKKLEKLIILLNVKVEFVKEDLFTTINAYVHQKK